MVLDAVVYNSADAEAKMGIGCTEMHRCPECEEYCGVFVSVADRSTAIGFTEDGQRFDKMIWENWKCLSCGNQWQHRYGVRHGV